jgi:hypothetical protein
MDTYTTMYHRRSVRRTAIRATALALALVGALAATSAPAPSGVEPARAGSNAAHTVGRESARSADAQTEAPALAGSKRLTTSESSVMQDAQELRLAGSKRLSTSESS